MHSLALTVATLTLAGTPPGAFTDILISSGWPRVLDVSGAHTVESGDQLTVLATVLDREQVLLVGGETGETYVTVVAGPEGARQRHLYRVQVIRDQTADALGATVQVTVGERRLVRVPGLARVVTGDASMCEALTAGPDSLALVPRSPGYTSVMYWAGGTSPAHRHRLLIVAVSGQARTVDENDSIITEPVGRLALISGERSFLHAPEATRFSIADPTVARVRQAAPGELVVEARREGATWLVVWTSPTQRTTRLVVVHDHGDPAVIEYDPTVTPEVRGPSSQ